MSDHKSELSDMELYEDNPTSYSKESLQNWNKDDKYQLYLGIRYRGSKAVNDIKVGFLPNKTEEEIEAAIAHYKETAYRNPVCAVRKMKVRRKVKSKPVIPLASWAKLLTDSLTYKELQTETVSALRLIADLENMPSPSVTEQIDFRQIYHHLADAMEGKSLPDDRLISDVLGSCVLDTALVSKSFISQSQLRSIVNNVNLKEKELSGFPRPTTDPELAIVRDLVAQRNYNPFNIPEDSLTKAVKSSTSKVKKL